MCLIGVPATQWMEHTLNPMRYVVRTDASHLIGSGHVMRSSAVAEELIARGEEVAFVGEYTSVPWLVPRIEGLGFSQIIPISTNFVSDSKTDVLILDSYYIPINDGFIQKSKWANVVVLVDKLTPAYEADLLIHPGLSGDWMLNSNVKSLFGPAYIPFRKSIKKNEKSLPNLKYPEILIVGGGTDNTNFVGAVCETLAKSQCDFHANIFTNKKELVQLDSRFTLSPIGSEIDENAAIANLILTTASTTSLEFIAREVAIGIGCAVSNQEENYKTLSAFRVCMPIGKFIESKWEIDKDIVGQLITSTELREKLRKKCANFIDLKGAERIVDAILSL